MGGLSTKAHGERQRSRSRVPGHCSVPVTLRPKAPRELHAISSTHTALERRGSTH